MCVLAWKSIGAFGIISQMFRARFLFRHRPTAGTSRVGETNRRLHNFDLSFSLHPHSPCTTSGHLKLFSSPHPLKFSALTSPFTSFSGNLHLQVLLDEQQLQKFIRICQTTFPLARYWWPTSPKNTKRWASRLISSLPAKRATGRWAGARRERRRREKN